MGQDVTDNKKRLPVVQKIESRDGTMAFDSKVVNGLVEAGSESNRAIKRGGLSVAFQGTSGVGQGIDAYLGVLYGVSGDVLNQYSTPSQLPVLVNGNAGFTSRDGAAQVGFLGKLWLIGGIGPSGVFRNDTWVSVDGVHWSLATGNPPSTRYGAKAIVMNGTLYVMGGLNASSVPLNDVWKTSDGLTWTQVTGAAPWGGRYDFEILLFNNAIYIAGGQGVSSTNGIPDPGLWHDVWTTSNGSAWVKQVGAAPWVGRRRFGFYAVGSIMYVLGGLLTSSNNTTFTNATTDLWSSANNGVTWTRVNGNAFGVGASPMLKSTVLTTNGLGAPYATTVTVTNGAGGSGAAAQTFVVGDDDWYEDECADFYDIDTVTFTTVGSGYTTPCTFVVNTQGVGIPAQGYGFLDGTSVSGGRGGEVVFDNNIYWYFTSFINGVQANEIWTSLDGITWTLLTASPGYASRGMQVFVFGNIWIIGGNSLGVTYYNDVWELNAGANTFALTPTVAGEFYNFNQTSTSITTPLLVFKAAHQGYYFNASLGTLNKITNANYPAVTAYGLVYLDTTFYVMDLAGRIWGSALNDPSTWTALNEIALQNEPNGGVGIAKIGNYVFALGQWSCEFFYDNANASPGSPLSANSTLAYQVGCAVGRSIVEMESTVIWIGQTATEGAKVYWIQGYTPQIISTPFIDRIIQTDPLTFVESFATTHFGHPLYVLTLVTVGITLVYDFNTQFWYTWNSDSNGLAIPLTSLTTAPFFNATFATAIASTAPLQHGLQDGDPVTVAQVGENQYNIYTNATVIDPQTFSYTIGSPADPQTGGFMQPYVVGVYNGVAGAELLDIAYVQDPSNGNVYSVDYTTGGDYGNPIDFQVVTGVWDGGVMHEKFITRASIVGDRAAANVWVRRTGSDYNTWTAYRPCNMNLTWPNITALGKTQRSAFQIRHTDFTPQRVEAIELEFEYGV